MRRCCAIRLIKIVNKIFPAAYYDDPANAQTELKKNEWREKMKADRKLYREQHGCKGCARYDPGLRLCKDAQTPHDGGFCKHHWDNRPKTLPPELL